MPIGVYKHKPLSEETKRKLSKAHKGKPAWNKGIPATEETKKKLRERVPSMSGKHHSEETKAKLSKSHKGKKFSEETREKMSKVSKNRHPSEETKRKISETLKGHEVSEETKKKMRGRKRSEETRIKLSESHKGQITWMKGKLHTKETKQKMSESHKGLKLSEETKEKISKANKGKILSEETVRKLSGENNHNWKGGISFERYSQDWTDDLKEAVRKRDNYICQLCGLHQDELDGWNKKLDVHHIDYQKNNLDPGNLVILCRSCHLKTNYDRDYWERYLKEKRGG